MAANGPPADGVVKKELTETSQELRKAALRVVGCQGVEVWQNSKTQIVPKVNSNCDKTKKKAQIMTKLKNLNYDITKKLK